MEFKLKRWGWYWTILEGQHFKIKLLYFKKGGEISLQRHSWRDELWCFVFGMGTFTTFVDESSKSIIPIMRGKHMSVPKQTWHHYKAEKRTMALEVQTGVCEEEDIERA